MVVGGSTEGFGHGEVLLGVVWLMEVPLGVEGGREFV